jgi:hypothetical protein
VPPPPGPGPELITASVADWAPGAPQDLITCVHGLHHVVDSLGLLARAASWLAPGGVLLAHFDPASIRRPDGTSAARPAVAALRAAGFAYHARRGLLTLESPGGPRALRLPFAHLGADPTAGPNRTGQPAPASYYRRPPC